MHQHSEIMHDPAGLSAAQFSSTNTGAPRKGALFVLRQTKGPSQVRRSSQANAS
ncbi:hypothetical protein KZ483_28100 [Paenibacillus sp. sptzw28]|uniref:hypothetical protein n=1 Tax=Paenibacillus sp. sptzw28 TaxID=715179 RepID=UPI001C6EDAB4|nr:hypothetical protein [Paenibacillus sp. sptzw28]QYR21477.1 hypothetical protein KZ483_28100 [Paenibacillus sp. sptzw28]